MGMNHQVSIPDEIWDYYEARHDRHPAQPIRNELMRIMVLDQHGANGYHPRVEERRVVVEPPESVVEAVAADVDEDEEREDPGKIIEARKGTLKCMYRGCPLYIRKGEEMFAFRDDDGGQHYECLEHRLKFRGDE